jgi:hypothetical protein
MLLEQRHLAGPFVVSSSQDAALPIRGIASRRARWGLGGFADMSEEAGDVLGLGDEGEEAHATAAAGARFDVDAERPLQKLGPRAIARSRCLASRRPEDVLEEGFASLFVVGTGARGGVQAEAEFANRERRGDRHAGVAVEGDLDGAAAELGAGWRETGDRGGGEPGERRLAFGEGVVDAQDVGVGVDVDDVATLEIREEARAGDLERIGHVSGRKSRKSPELKTAVGGRGVHAVQEDDVEVRIQLQVGGSALHGDDGTALDALARAGAEAASVPAEDGVDEDARDGAEELAVEAETRKGKIRVLYS